MASISLYDLLTPDQERDVFVNTVDMMLKISYQIEDIVIDNELPVDFFAGFQRFSYFSYQSQRYRRLAEVARRIYVFGEPDITPPTLPGVQFIPLPPGDPLSQEWFLVVNTPTFFTTLLTQEVPGADPIRGDRRFRGVWTYDEQLISNAHLLLTQYLRLPYRPVTQRDYRAQNQYLVRMSNKMVQFSEAATLGLAQSEGTVSMLSQVAQAMDNSPRLEDALNTIARAVQSTLQTQTLRIYLADGDPGALRLAAGVGGSGMLPVAPVSFGQGIAGETAAQARPVLIPDTFEAGESDPLDSDVQSLAAVPLLGGTRVLGVLVAGRAPVNAFDDLAVRLLQAVAAQISLAVKRSEQASAHERLERLFQIVLASAAEGIIITDARGVVTMLNAAAGEALGVDATAMRHQPLTALGSEDLNLLAQEVEARGGDSFREVGLPSGQTILAGAALVRDGNGVLLGRVLALRDIAPGAESAPPEEVSGSGELLATAGTGLALDRDLDNRLRQISGLTALLPARIPLNEEQNKFVGQIIKLTRETARLVNNLVYLNQLETGEILTREATDLPALLADLVERYQHAAARRGITLKLLVEPVPPMPINASAFTRAIQNLIENGIKYTPAGGAVVVGLEVQGGVLRLTVSDTGIGLWPRDLSLVFNRFYRVINAQNQETPSGGLGLSVVRAVAEAHGGRAWAESTLGQGSMFSLAVPVSTRAPDDSRQELAAGVIG